ncbi:MAG: threonylcarbamoyl-AMP synthase [Calditrichaeota bacterium]|nr:MAG: threonylcarbamoyl-AMP synthase [Calditrichota bacterium]
MIRFEIHLDTPHQRVIQKTAEELRNGKVVIYPTDTVYGIGCSIYAKHAIEKLYRLKGKSKFEAMSILCESIQQASKFVHITNYTFRILKRCFPGPYTIILRATREIPKLMLSRRKEIGVRIPDSPVCQMLINELGHPLVNTSAGLSEDFIFHGQHSMDNELLRHADIFLDAGPLPDPRDSTVIRLIDDELEIIREGKGEIDRLLR